MANPILNEKFISQEHFIQGEPMTVNGTIQVTAFLAVMLVASAAFVWSRATLGYTDLVNMLTFGGVIGGFVLALIISFSRIKYLIPVYAVCEGLALGGVSAYFESLFPGIVMQAIAGTFAALFAMLILYSTKMIRCTEKFRSVVFISTASIAVLYIMNFIGSFFSLSIPIINSNSIYGIGFSLIVIVIAALNLILDFDFIEKAAERMCPKDTEWFGAFGLLLTLVWLYLEVLRLLAKMQSRD